MDVSEKKLNKLKEFVELLKESLTREEFIEAFKKVMEIIQKLKEENARELDRIISAFGLLKEKLNSDTSTTLGKAERTITAELESILRRFSAESKKIDDKLATIENGQDADEEKIVSDVLTQIKLPEYKEVILDNGEQILDKIAGLLRIEDIKDLQNELEELRKLRTGRFGGGGTPKTRMISEIPSGTINSSNTTFTITTTPMIGHALFLNSVLQREGAAYEYTIVNKIITYNTAPPTNSQHYILIFR